MIDWENHVLNAAWAAARLGIDVVITCNDAGFAVVVGQEPPVPVETAVVHCLAKYEYTNRFKSPLRYSVQAKYALGRYLYEGVG